MKAEGGPERKSAGQHQGAAVKKGWQTKTLGEACEMYQPKTISGKDMVEDGPYPVYGANGVIGRYNQFNHEEPQLLITCRGATCGSVNISAPRSWVTGNAMVVRPKNESLEMRYLEYLFRGGIDISKAITGAAQPQITRTNLEPLEISFPESLAEQQRIVGLLDEAFEGLATAKANAEKNLQNARALFESHLQSVFTQRGPGWVEKSLGETCEMYQPKTIGTKDLVPDGPYPVFGANGVIGRYDKFNHEEPQLLVTCRGATCGSVNISEPNSWITGNAMVVRPKDHALDLHFLAFVFRGGIDISAAITGAAQPQITRTNLSPLLIRFPKSVTEQTRLAEKFEDLTEETQRLARLYERKHAALEALKRSLLHQAFAGEL